MEQPLLLPWVMAKPMPHEDSSMPAGEPDVATGREPEVEIKSALGLGRSHDRRRWLVRVALAAGAVALLALGMLVVQGLTAPARVEYATEPVTRGRLAVSVVATGVLEPRNTVEVGSEISGLVQRVLVDVNDTVTEGQVLAELDPARYQAQLEQARAQLALARAQLEQARVSRAEASRQRERVEGLSSQAIAEQARDQAVSAARRAEAAVAVARASVRHARAALSVAETNLGRAVVRSPIDGVVLSRSVEEGQIVVASLQAPVLFRIAESLESMTVSVDVDEAEIAAVQPGQEATFTVPAYYDRAFDARVTEVHKAAQMIERVVTYEAELDVANPELLLRPGMTVTARIFTEVHDDALMVPNQALRFQPPGLAEDQRPVTDRRRRGDLERVWLLQGGQLVAVPVTLGASNDTHTAVTSAALHEGAEVVVNVR